MVSEEQKKKELEEERRQKREQAEKEARQRNINYEKRREAETSEKLAAREHETRESIRNYRKQAIEQQAELDDKMQEESAKAMEDLKALNETAKAESMKQTKEVKDATNESIKQLNQENAKIKEDIQQREKELANAADDRRKKNLSEQEAVSKLRKKLAAEEKEKNENNFNQILKTTQDNQEAECETEKAVFLRSKEHYEEQKKQQQELINEKVSSHLDILHAKTAQIKRGNIKAMNYDINVLQTVKDDVQNSYTSCLRCLTTNITDYKYAERQFNSLDLQLQYLSTHMIKMERKLSEIPDLTRKNDLALRIRKVKGKQGDFISCVAGFSGRMSSGEKSWKNDDVKEFRELFKKLGEEIDAIQSLDSGTDVLINQLKSSLASCSSSSSATNAVENGSSAKELKDGENEDNDEEEGDEEYEEVKK